MLRTVNWSLELCFMLLTMLLFLLALALNTWLFERLEHVRGISWVFLPAGIRLLCTLLFGHAGALGLLIVSWLVCFLYFFPGDPERAFVGGVISALAPYLVYLGARHYWGLGASLSKISPDRLLLLSLAYAFANSFLHHVYFGWRGQTELLHGLTAMFVGDLGGTLLVLYAIKLVLVLVPRPQA